MLTSILKERKVTNGAIRNKARTMQKMVDAVGTVLKQKGYTGLTTKNICEAAGVDRKLVITYFDNVNNLIETYLKQKDFWTAQVAPRFQDVLLESEFSNKDQLTNMMHTLFDTMFESEDLRRIMHWEISESNKLLRDLSESREAFGAKLLKRIDAYFGSAEVDLRAIFAIQVAGIYYLSLHAKANGSTFCEIDTNSVEGSNRIKNALQQMIDIFWEKAESKR